jgi:hypothetical protein
MIKLEYFIYCIVFISLFVVPSFSFGNSVNNNWLTNIKDEPDPNSAEKCFCKVN